MKVFGLPRRSVRPTTECARYCRARGRRNSHRGGYRAWQQEEAVKLCHLWPAVEFHRAVLQFQRFVVNDAFIRFDASKEIH